MMESLFIHYTILDFGMQIVIYVVTKRISCSDLVLPAKPPFDHPLAIQPVLTFQPSNQHGQVICRMNRIKPLLKPCLEQ